MWEMIKPLVLTEIVLELFDICKFVIIVALIVHHASKSK